MIMKFNKLNWVICLNCLFISTSILSAATFACSSIDPSQGFQLAGSQDNDFWDKKRLTVSFLDRNPAYESAVKKYASDWSAACGVSFVFTQNVESDIRISFKNTGVYNSAVGIRAIGIPQNQETMNLGFESRLTEEDVKRKVLHEFGHALGFVHEHQSPKTSIKWNKVNVLAETKTWGWSESQTEYNIFRKQQSGNSSDFDQSSIMIYPIPSNWTLDNYSIPYNTRLSKTDKMFSKKIYDSVGDFRWLDAPSRKDIPQLVNGKSHGTLWKIERLNNDLIRLRSWNDFYRAETNAKWLDAPSRGNTPKLVNGRSHGSIWKIERIGKDGHCRLRSWNENFRSEKNAKWLDGGSDGKTIKLVSAKSHGTEWYIEELRNNLVYIKSWNNNFRQ